MSFSIVWAAALFSGGAGASAAEAMSLSDQDVCRRFAAIAAPVGEADLRSGADVRGGAVAPADLEPSPEWTRNGAVDLEVRVRLGAVPGNPPSRLEGDIPLGQLAVEEGQLLLDGAPLSRDDHARIAARCAGL